MVVGTIGISICDTLLQAREREQYYISKNEHSKSVRTKEEHLQYMRDYYSANKEWASIKHAERYKNDEEYRNKTIERSKVRHAKLKSQVLEGHTP